MENQTIRHLADPSNTTGTLLTLPRSDFPRSKKGEAAINNILRSVEPPTSNDDDNDRLLLVRLPSSGVTLDDLQSRNVYILGDTSEHDIDHSSGANGQCVMDGEGGVANGNGMTSSSNIHVPIPTRLIVEGKSEDGRGAISNNAGKTLELMRVETSNTYVLVPPMPVDKDASHDNATNGNNTDGNGSKKRQKVSPVEANKQLTTMPARSVGLVPGEESPACFFLEPVHLQSGHYAPKLRWALSRWVYDPLDPPGDDLKFGYGLSDLAHICRTSESEIGYALSCRVWGADDALVIPVGEPTTTTSDDRRYGILSEEGRQTVSMAILSALLESDVDLAWYFSDDDQSKSGNDVSLLLKDVRTHWHNLEDDGVINSRRESCDAPVLSDSRHATETQDESQSQFYTPAEFHNLKSGDKDSVLCDEVIWHCLRPMVRYTACAHKDVMPKTVWLVPDEVAKLAAHNVFLRSSNSDGWNESDFIESWNMRMPSISKYEPSMDLLRGIALSDQSAGQDDCSQKVWKYFPEAGLPLVPSLRIKSMFAMCSEWTLDGTIPYLRKFACGAVEECNGSSNADLGSEIKSLLEKHAKVANNTEKNGATKYVLMNS